MALYGILAELRKQTAILQRISAGIEQLTEVNQFAITVGGTLNLEIFDDGKGVKFTATPDHPLKPGETPVWSTEDPTILVVTQDPNDPTGLTAIGTLPTPAKDATGFVATKISVKRLDGQDVSTPAPAIDIVPDPNAEVGGFVIQEAAL